MQQIRTFIAVDIASSIRNAIRKAVRPIREAYPNIRWVDDSQFHVTLKFLGDVSMNDLLPLIKGVEQACRSIEPFDLVFQELGAFPNPSNPSSIWVGVSEGVEEVRQLVDSLEDELVKIGWPREKRLFTPHLTVGRVKRAKGPNRAGPDLSPDISEIFEQFNGKYFGCSGVDEVVVYSSELSREGPRYEVLATAPLSPMFQEE